MIRLLNLWRWQQLVNPPLFGLEDIYYRHFGLGSSMTDSISLPKQNQTSSRKRVPDEALCRKRPTKDQVTIS